MSDWEEVKARLEEDSDSMVQTVSWWEISDSTANRLGADIRAALQRVNDLENACMVHHDEMMKLREEFEQARQDARTAREVQRKAQAKLARVVEALERQSDPMMVRVSLALAAAKEE